MKSDQGQAQDSRKTEAERDREGIVKFFLNLFRLQTGAKPMAPVRVARVAVEGTRYVFELRIRHQGRWESRRMSVALIGDEEPSRSAGGGKPPTTKTKTRASKSKCFKVIYDTLLVVKVPPAPIRDFGEYVNSIRAEARIAEKLAPDIEFVAPGVTALLRKIHPLPDMGSLPPAEVERRYIAWLKHNPSYQRYLKIDDGFAFFMDLSKYAFLSQVVEGMHDREMFREKMRKEIIGSHNLLWDILEFEEKYGSELLTVCFDMNKLYSVYEARITPLLKEHNLSASISAYQKQEWFLAHLAEGEVTESGGGLPPDFVSGLNSALKEVITEHKGTVSAYRKAVFTHIYQRTFQQHRPQMSGIISNILTLLATLNERKIAIRDLKPDNLFVVADSSRHPHHLQSTEESSLGLIDFETAVDFSAGTANGIPQPLLAGTPAYATPAHLFPNAMLEETLGNLPRILHLQDWQAAVAMIYYTVTGEFLFERTRKLLFHTKSTIRKTTLENRPLSEGFVEASRTFWASAVTELKEKLERREGSLRSVPVHPPESALTYLIDTFMAERRSLLTAIQSIIKSQVIFTSTKNRKNLLQSPAEEIERHLKKWESGTGVPKSTPQTRQQIILLLRTLAHLKGQIRRHDEAIARLEVTPPRVTAYELVEAMFAVVVNAMYKEAEWGDLEASIPGETGEEAILYEETILFEATA